MRGFGSRHGIRRILIYRIGGLGDLVVTLPILNALRDQFPSAEMALLTPSPHTEKSISNTALFENSGFFTQIILYPYGARRWRVLARTICEARRFGPDLTINLTPRGTLVSALRDNTFLALCGTLHIWGAPLLRRGRLAEIEVGRLWESEAARLIRIVQPRLDRDIDAGADRAWSLDLGADDETQLIEAIGHRPGFPYVIFNPGGRFDTQHWGDERWNKTLGAISSAHPGLGLIAVGSAAERSRIDHIIAAWAGPKLNFCGLTGPRQNALLMQDGTAFLGQDSGPLHLAAAVGLQCVAVFSARNHPGHWFPRGRGHQIVQHLTPCFGCGLQVCHNYKKACLTEIEPEAVVAAFNRVTEGKLASASNLEVGSCARSATVPISPIPGVK